MTKPISDEQLAELDALAASLLEGGSKFFEMFLSDYLTLRERLRLVEEEASTTHQECVTILAQLFLAENRLALADAMAEAVETVCRCDREMSSETREWVSIPAAAYRAAKEEEYHTDEWPDTSGCGDSTCEGSCGFAPGAAGGHPEEEE